MAKQKKSWKWKVKNNNLQSFDAVQLSQLSIFSWWSSAAAAVATSRTHLLSWGKSQFYHRRRCCSVQFSSAMVTSKLPLVGLSSSVASFVSPSRHFFSLFPYWLRIATAAAAAAFAFIHLPLRFSLTRLIMQPIRKERERERENCFSLWRESVLSFSNFHTRNTIGNSSGNSCLEPIKNILSSLRVVLGALRCWMVQFKVAGFLLLCSVATASAAYLIESGKFCKMSKLKNILK